MGSRRTGGNAVIAAFEGFLALACEKDVVRSRAGGRVGQSVLVGQRNFAGGLAQVIAGGIGRDREEPRAERAAVVEAVELEIGFHKSILGEIGSGVFIPGVTAQKCDERRALLPHHRAKVVAKLVAAALRR